MTTCEIIDIVCIEMLVSSEEILGKSKPHKIAQARMLAMYFVAVTQPISLIEVGTIFNRHHSIIIYAIKKIKDEYSVDRSYKNMVNRLMDIITPGDGLLTRKKNTSHEFISAKNAHQYSPFILSEI